MTREEAIQLILSHLDHEIVIAANGMISREAMAARDRPENFYMIGSMGLASSIGLGLALSRPERRVVVLDGDGNLLMNLGSVPTIGWSGPMNFVHIVLDNAAHASTGNQPTATQQVPLEEMARVAGYRETSRVRNKDALIHALVRLLKEPGPTFLLVELELGDRGEAIPRVSLIPDTITNRIRSILAASSGAFP